MDPSRAREQRQAVGQRAIFPGEHNDLRSLKGHQVGRHWDPLTEEWFAIVLTTDPDGSLRETRVVFVVMEDTGIVRTGSTLWFANIQRDSEFRLRIGGNVYRVRAELIDDEEAQRAINAEFRAKYGLGDWLVDWFRPRDRNVLRMRERRSASNVLEATD